MANSLVLTIKTSPSIILAQDASKTDNITLGDTEYLMVLQSIGFTKKMYKNIFIHEKYGLYHYRSWRKRVAYGR